MDTDGDGVLSMFELEYFYEEQCERMERMGIEPLPFQDLLCQMLDLVKPENQGECQRQLGLRVSTGETKPAFLSEVHTPCVCVYVAHSREDNPWGSEALPDGSHILRYFLQPGEIPGPRTERPVCCAKGVNLPLWHIERDLLTD